MSTRFSRNLFRLITGRKLPRLPKRARSALHRGGPARDTLYLSWIRTLPCAACGHGSPSEAAHTGRDGGTGIKASDYSAVPLCYQCHRVGIYSYHIMGKNTFATMFAIDFDALVQRYNGLWEKVQGVRVFDESGSVKAG